MVGGVRLGFSGESQPRDSHRVFAARWILLGALLKTKSPWTRAFGFRDAL